MNSLADDLALALGVDDVVERAEEPVARLHVHEVDLRTGGGTSPRPARPRCSRSRPVSTNTHVSWSPIALCTSAAATAESTPPDSPQITRSSPTWARISATACSMIETFVHVGPAAGDVEEERLQDLLAALGVRDLGVELHAVDRRGRGSSNAAAGVSSVRRGDREARAAPAVIVSKWLIHTTCSIGLLAEQQRRARSTVQLGAAVLARARSCATSPPRSRATSCAP